MQGENTGPGPSFTCRKENGGQEIPCMEGLELHIQVFKLIIYRETDEPLSS